MDEKEVKKLVGEIDSRVAMLKSALSMTAITSTTVTKARKTKGAAKKGAGSSVPITKLVEEGFFDQPKTYLEVIAVLRKKGLTFTKGNITTPLRRKVVQGLLERDGEGTKDNPWRYKKP